MSDAPQILAPDPHAYERVTERLGRLPAIDPRDRRFSMAAPRATRTFRSWLGPKEIFDQGNRSTCVAFACNRFLLQHNVVNKPPMSYEEFYSRAQKVDEWPGEEPDYYGTSVRAGFRVLKEIGYVSRYEWAFTIDQIINHTLEVGPIVAGTDWCSGMWKTDSHNYLWPTGSVIGGHAYLFTAINTKRVNPDGSRGAIRATNSWSKSWGDNGKAWISFDALEELIRGKAGWPGEFATAFETRVP